jgi:predicted ABC-type ATPase
MSDDNPQVIIIAGPNGAGKTTLAPSLLSRVLLLPDTAFVNADEIADKEIPDSFRGNVAMKAGRIMLGRLHDFFEQRQTFAFETTLAPRSYVRLINQWRASRYEVHLLFVWLRSVELAIERVAERVRGGGHSISHADVSRRYEHGLKNLVDLYIPIVDMWAVYDNSEGSSPSLVATGGIARRPRIDRPDIWQKLQDQ